MTKVRQANKPGVEFNDNILSADRKPNIFKDLISNDLNISDEYYTTDEWLKEISQLHFFKDYNNNNLENELKYSLICKWMFPNEPGRFESLRYFLINKYKTSINKLNSVELSKNQSIWLNDNYDLIRNDYTDWRDKHLSIIENNMEDFNRYIPDKIYDYLIVVIANREKLEKHLEYYIKMKDKFDKRFKEIVSIAVHMHCDNNTNPDGISDGDYDEIIKYLFKKINGRETLGNDIKKKLEVILRNVSKYKNRIKYLDKLIDSDITDDEAVEIKAVRDQDIEECKNIIGGMKKSYKKTFIEFTGTFHEEGIVMNSKKYNSKKYIIYELITLFKFIYENWSASHMLKFSEVFRDALRIDSKKHTGKVFKKVNDDEMQKEVLGNYNETSFEKLSIKAILIKYLFDYIKKVTIGKSLNGYFGQFLNRSEESTKQMIRYYVNDVNNGMISLDTGNYGFMHENETKDDNPVRIDYINIAKKNIETFRVKRVVIKTKQGENMVITPLGFVEVNKKNDDTFIYSDTLVIFKKRVNEQYIKKMKNYKDEQEPTNNSSNEASAATSPAESKTPSPVVSDEEYRTPMKRGRNDLIELGGSSDIKPPRQRHTGKKETPPVGGAGGSPFGESPSSDVSQYDGDGQEGWRRVLNGGESPSSDASQYDGDGKKGWDEVLKSFGGESKTTKLYRPSNPYRYVRLRF